MASREEILRAAEMNVALQKQEWKTLKHSRCDNLSDYHRALHKVQVKKAKYYYRLALTNLGLASTEFSGVVGKVTREYAPWKMRNPEIGELKIGTPVFYSGPYGTLDELTNRPVMYACFIKDNPGTNSCYILAKKESDPLDWLGGIKAIKVPIKEVFLAF